MTALEHQNPRTEGRLALRAWIAAGFVPVGWMLVLVAGFAGGEGERTGAAGDLSLRVTPTPTARDGTCSALSRHSSSPSAAGSPSLSTPPVGGAARPEGRRSVQ
ncbi:MAG: hypothetical protein ACXV3S_02210 [Kineosporiaceae bacterium]